MKTLLMLTMSVVVLLTITSCTCNEKKPLERAFYNETSKYGMQYHITLYQPSYGGGTHSFKCGSWSYSPFHVFTDRLGILRGDEVIIKSIDMVEPPYVDHGQNLGDISLIISRDMVKISGVNGGVYNGTYKVETTSPNSWGVPIEQGIQIPNEN